jgi:hypothetical protein
VSDQVVALRSLIGGAAGDSYFMSVCAMREDEAIAASALDG